MDKRDRNDIIEVSYYDSNGYGTHHKTRERHSRGTFILALLLCATLFFTGGGIFGIYLAEQSEPEIEASVQTEESAVPELLHSPAPSEETSPLPQAQAPEEREAEDAGGASYASQVNPEGREMSLTELFSGANPAVVAISTETTGINIFGQTVTTPASGSGFIISEDGYIVTNNHVIEAANSITAVLHDGAKYAATLVGNDPVTDLAVLKINARGLSYLTFGNSDNIQVGEQVAAIGNPLGEFANSFTVGYISALNRRINVDGTAREMLQTDTAVNSGNSGGPLLNTRGRVIGVVSAKSTGTNVEGLGFAIPSNTAADIAAQLIDSGYVSGRAAIGASLSTRNGIRQTFIYVEAIVTGRPADRAGLKVGDFILAADGRALYSVSDLSGVLAVKSPGEKLTLEIQRGNNRHKLTLTLDEYRPIPVSNKSADAA